MKVNKKTGRYYKEQTRWIEGYEGEYKISTSGEVISYWRDWDGTYYINNTLTGVPDKDGYLWVSLYSKREHKTRKHAIHRLVALTFLKESRSDYNIVDHKDTNKTNNCILNLHWTDAKGNMNNPITKAKRKSNNLKAENKTKTRSKTRKVICTTTGKVFDTLVEAGDYYGVNTASISKCCKGKRKSAGKLSDGTKLVWEYAN